MGGTSKGIHGWQPKLRRSFFQRFDLFRFREFGIQLYCFLPKKKLSKVVILEILKPDLIKAVKQEL
jgi:hypothetical protein